MPPNHLNENDVYFQEEGLPFSPPTAPSDAIFRHLRVKPPRPQIDNTVEKEVALLEAQRDLDAEHAARVKAEKESESLKLQMRENAKLCAMLKESLQRAGRLPNSLVLVGRRALILGGGPAGLALAVSLSQRGCMVQVHERTTEEQTKSKGFGWLLMPNGVKALEALGVKKRCLREARAIESTETYVHRQEGGNKDEVEGIFSCTREDLVSGMIEVLPKGCVIRGSRVLDIETEGNAEKTTVTAVKVMAASGQESWLKLRQPNQENDFDYVFGADGVNSLLARRLNPEMSRLPGGSHNTIVTCLKDDRLAQQLGARFVKTYFHSVSKGQCCAFGILSPAMGVVLGFMQFSTVLHGTAPYKSEKNLHADIRGFIIDVLGLPSVITENEPENMRLLRAYLGALSRDDFDYHIWRFVPTGFAAQSHGVNCALLGDALHPMSDFSSQGVSSAIGDAVLLGKCLSAEAAADGTDESISAFESYDSECRNVVSNLIAAGERIKDNFISGRGLLRRSFTRSGSFDSSTKDTASTGSPEEGFGNYLTLDAARTDDNNFLDPSLVNMPVLSMQAYNYRWATLPSGVIPLSAASSDFPVCPAIVSTLKDHFTQGYFCYGPNEGLPQFRESFAAYFSDRLARGVAFCKEHKEEGSMRFGSTTIEAGQVMATNAAAAAVYASAAATILQPGDEALVMSPVDFLLSKSVTSMGGVVIHYSIKTRNGGKNPTFDLAEMQTLVTPRTRMLSICNPHNPLGRAWKLRELQDLVNFAEHHGLSIVSDEVWSDLVHAPRVHIPTACVSPYAAMHTYSIFGFSKSHGLEGLRIGALVAPSVEQLTKALTLSHTDTTANGASVAAQVAAITAMTEAGSHAVGWLASWRLHLRACVRHAVMRLNKMEGVHAIEPEAGFVIWANISRLLYHDIQNTNTFSNDEEPEMELMQWLISEQKVCVIPGLDRFFGPGSKGHIRLSVATSKPVLDEALDRLERGLKLWLQQRQASLKSLSPRSTFSALTDMDDNGGVENSAEDVNETDANRESDDENGSVDTKYLAGIANATKDLGHKAEGVRDVCVVDKDASSEGQEGECNVVADASSESEACRTLASSDKLTAMMFDRVQEIKSIRGFLEREKVQGQSNHQRLIYLLYSTFSSQFCCNPTAENCALSESVLRHDVACKGQANKELMKTVDHLKSKNLDYAQKVNQLYLMVDELILSKNENIKRISVLENDAAAKTFMINEITAEIHHKNNILEEKTAENDELAKQLQRFKADGLKAAVQDLESTNTTFAIMLEKVLTENKSLDATMANLVTSLKEAMAYQEEVSCQNKEIQTKIDAVNCFVAQAFENIAGAIGQLEKDVEEEFQVTTQLKKGTEKFIRKLREDKNFKYADDVENLLEDVRMIRSWQLSHFQLVNELVTQNRDQVRSIQLLPAFRIFNFSKVNAFH